MERGGLAGGLRPLCPGCSRPHALLLRASSALVPRPYHQNLIGRFRLGRRRYRLSGTVLESPPRRLFLYASLDRSGQSTHSGHPPALAHFRTSLVLVFLLTVWIVLLLS